MTERELRDGFGNHAVDALRAQLGAGASPQVDVGQLKLDVASKSPWIDVTKLLDAAVAVDWVKRIDTFSCAGCGNMLDNEFMQAGECPICGADLTSSDTKPVPMTVYVSQGPLSRSVPWLVAIHGFNTLGPWQEAFGWLVASLYRYPAPVLTYKYGLLRVGVLFRWRHNILVKRLGAKLSKAASEAKQRGFDEAPDVIAHSFGTQLLRLVLESPELRNLKFGRVITVGSVVRPDFNWSEQVAAGRVQAVLNQCGGKDRAVPLAQFTIPGSGPGGRQGFVDPVVINVKGGGFGHSTALAADRLHQVLNEGGDFERFLRLPLASYENATQFTPESWTAAPWVVRLITRTVVIALLGLVGFAFAAAVIVGGWVLVEEAFQLLHSAAAV